ncbi:hypothetical protein M404DRAFT_993281 [Pisolithus tinctorius Marx 270]|uniref:Uncharacterized protein n=1 Tax=Pisolithus tinctorius Marx 270 TaxID=870435 RepID=A0A0C3PI43_PISTI|nr:hypothetical protein M404DRAFT_993281 [Pisolithus tinctorius Marx 270]
MPEIMYHMANPMAIFPRNLSDTDILEAGHQPFTIMRIESEQHSCRRLQVMEPGYPFASRGTGGQVEVYMYHGGLDSNHVRLFPIFNIKSGPCDVAVNFKTFVVCQIGLHSPSLHPTLRLLRHIRRHHHLRPSSWTRPE